MERKPRSPKITSTARARPRRTGQRLVPASVEPGAAPDAAGGESRPRSQAPLEQQPGAQSGDGVHQEARIRERAYFLYEASGCQHGHALDHWLEAEREILAQDARQ